MAGTSILDPVVAEHIRAVNAFDEDAIVATFADDALVNDARREVWGTEAIRRWVASEIVGAKVTICGHPGHSALRRHHRARSL